MASYEYTARAVAHHRPSCDGLIARAPHGCARMRCSTRSGFAPELEAQLVGEMVGFTVEMASNGREQLFSVGTGERAY